MYKLKSIITMSVHFTSRKILRLCMVQKIPIAILHFNAFNSSIFTKHFVVGAFLAAAGLDPAMQGV